MYQRGGPRDPAFNNGASPPQFDQTGEVAPKVMVSLVVSHLDLAQKNKTATLGDIESMNRSLLNEFSSKLIGSINEQPR